MPENNEAYLELPDELLFNEGDEMYLESADIEIIIKLILQLNKEGHEVYLKVHPREDRELWVGFVKKYNLNVTLAHWRVPFSHWVSELDYVIGPSSTSFYDCCVAGVQPICTRKINKNRDLHINKFSEEYGALMEYIVTPESIDEIIDFVCEKNESFDMNNEIKQVLLNETNYPDSNNSIDKMVESVQRTESSISNQLQLLIQAVEGNSIAIKEKKCTLFRRSK